MNDDRLDPTMFALFTALPAITTRVDGQARVIEQFKAEGTPLFTPRGETFLASRAPESSRLLREAVQTSKPVHFETHLTRAEGDDCWYEHDVIVPPGYALIVISRDITAQKTRDTEFNQIKRRYGAIVQNVSDAISISTWGTSYDDNILLEVNQRTVEMLGYSFDELRAMRPSDILAQDYKPKAYRHRALRETGELVETPMQFPIRRKDGSIGYVESLGMLVEDEDGRTVETIALVRDVTEHVEREENLRQARVAAEAALTARDVFVANVSEELRQPIGDILEHTRLLLRRAGTPDDIIKRLHRIYAEAENLNRQIGDVLDLTRVEAGFDAVKLSLFNLPHLLRRLEEGLRLKALQGNLTLHFERADDLPILIQTDETKLKQILVNLIGDALKATKHGEVLVRALCQPDHLLRFEIQDSRHLADGEVHANHALGIAISARLVDVLSGQLEIAQTVEGTTITIDLPFQPVRSASAARDMPALPSQQQLELLSETWLHEMYSFCIAGQTEQALAHVNALDPTQADTAVQLGALITLFHLDQIVDLIEPIIDRE